MPAPPVFPTIPTERDIVSNTIRARVEFSYKGETHVPSAIIDLDDLMRKSETGEHLHRALAHLNGIDTYSYLYEVMEGYDVEFDQPTGLALEAVRDGQFDMTEFVRIWRESQYLDQLSAIAAEHLGVDDLGGRPELRRALSEAFQAGVRSRASEE